MGPRMISIKSYAYAPGTVTVAVGTRVTFTNHDSTAHTATATSPALDTGSIGAGKSATVTLSHAGTYHYICQFHPFMHGTLIVR